MNDKPAPIPNSDTRPFWEACNEERLIFQRCRACGYHQFYPRSLCKKCASEALEWVTAEPRGTVYSFTVQHRAPTQAFRDDCPYVIALVDLEDGIRLMMNVKNCEPEDVYIGMPVRIIFEERGEEKQKMPQSEPIS